jgi:cytochrome b561
MTVTPKREDLARYDRFAMLLHWLVAALILASLFLIWFVDSYPEDWVRPVIDTHKSFGIVVLGLVLLRLLWRVGHRPPPFPESYHQHEQWAAHAAHWILYVLMLGLPLTGWIHDSAWKDAETHPMSLFGLLDWPRIALILEQPAASREAIHSLFFGFHRALAYALYAVFLLHVAAALKHQWLDRQLELQRMLPRLGKHQD